MFKTLNKCRLCSGPFYQKTLKLKDTPPANELYVTREQARAADKFPLEVVMCTECKHVQLKHIVNPKRLFDDYVYKSGTSSFFKHHFDKLAEQVVSKFPIQSYVLEIGSNDGILLRSFENREVKSIGVEPSAFLANECISSNQTVYNSYFNQQVVNEILTTHGHASIVVGNNVFAHIEDLNEAFKNVTNVLNPTGMFIFEVAHFKYIYTIGIFDTIYHEHMSYHTAFSMEKFARNFGFKIVSIEEIPSHGGSLRFFLSKDQNMKVDSSVDEIIKDEVALGLNTEKALELIEEKIKSIKLSVSQIIGNLLSNQDMKFFGYGAPAKVVTFLAQMDLENLDLIGVIDDNLSKQGKYLPGSGFKVSSVEEVKQNLVGSNKINTNISTCLIFPWNLKSEILKKLKEWSPTHSNAVLFFPTVEKVDI
jgi:2-polyprenyl-3-methyl-5-hydroxy-6-metoxy-1,4-benzoquinol methylase